MVEPTQDQIDAAVVAEQLEMERAQVEHLKSRVILLRAQLDAALLELSDRQEKRPD